MVLVMHAIKLPLAGDESCSREPTAVDEDKLHTCRRTLLLQ